MADKPENLDDAKGRVKEGAGNVTGDKEMQREGKGDQVAGKAKSALDSARDKTKEAIDDVRDRLNR